VPTRNYVDGLDIDPGRRQLGGANPERRDPDQAPGTTLSDPVREEYPSTCDGDWFVGQRPRRHWMLRARLCHLSRRSDRARFAAISAECLSGLNDYAAARSRTGGVSR
jgi:hypothetical protein